MWRRAWWQLVAAALLSQQLLEVLDLRAARRRLRLARIKSLLPHLHCEGVELGPMIASMLWKILPAALHTSWTAE